MAKLTFKEFFENLKNGRLLGLKCKSCGKITCPPQTTCQECGGEELEIVEMKKSGTIKTFTVIHVPPTGLEDEAPYVVCDIETDDGSWLIGRLDVPPEKATIDLVGKRVSIEALELPCKGHYLTDKERRIVPLFKLQE
ncbi:nucleic acid-binding protein [Candidatus Bathyarchaeota archaeon]|nr:MAG: nucleic acid-binding protein [Candidatus Bathyarchaeota archaeon]